MKRNRSIESLSSISSESSESDSDDDDEDSDQSSQSKESDESNDGDSVNQRRKRHKKKRKQVRSHSQKQGQRKKSMKKQQTLRLDVNRQKTVNSQEPNLQRQKSRSIDSPQKIQIRPKARQMSYQNNNSNMNKVQNDGKTFQFNPHNQNRILNQQRRLQKSNTININDNYLVYNKGGNSKLETNVDIDEDYNMQTNFSHNKTGSETLIRGRKRSSVVSNISNESNTSLQQLYDKKYQQLGVIVNQDNAHQIPNQVQNKNKIPQINIVSVENEEVDQLKLEKQDLKNQLVEEKKRQSKLELINNSLAKEYDQQNQLLNTINNKLDLKAANNQAHLTDRNNLKIANELSAFTKQAKKQKNSFIYKIVSMLNRVNPFKSYQKKINQKIGDSANIYFEFVIYLIFVHIIIAIAYMYFYFDYLINSSQKYDSNYQSFISYLMSHNYTSNTHVSYTITFILMVVLQILMNLIKYLLEARAEVAFKAQYGKKLKTFRLIFNSWDMNIQQQDYVERMKVSLVNRIRNLMHFSNGKKKQEIEIEPSRKKKDLKRISGFQKGLMIITIFLLNLGFIICSLILTSLILNSNSMQTSKIIFLNQMLQSFGVSIVAYTSGYFMKILTVCESWFHHSFKNLHLIQYLKMLFAHLFVLALFIYLNISQIKYPNDTYKFLMFETIPFNSETYNCPEEQFSYSLLSLIFAYTLTCLIIQYLPTVKSILFNYICSPSRTQSETERSFYNLSAFNPIDNLIPLIILNILSICIAPLFPFIFLITTLLILLVFFHNYLYVGRFKMASFEIIDKIQCRNIIVQFYTICNVLAFIFFGFLLSLNYQKSYFNATQNDMLRICGSFQTGDTPLSVFQSYLDQSSFVGYVYEFINFRPFLWVFLLLFLFAFLIKNSTQQEWKSQYKQKQKELDMIKDHYQQQIYNIQEKIISVRQNFNQTVSPKTFYTPPNSKQTLQRESNPNSTGKNSPINACTTPQNINQNYSGSSAQGGSGQLNSQNSLNNALKDSNNISRPSLFQRTHKQSATYSGIGYLGNPLDSFSAAVNRFS